MRNLLIAAAAAVLAACSTATPPAHGTAAVDTPASPASASSTSTQLPPAATTAPRETKASDLVDHAGDSVETAVTVPADAPNDGVRWENDWMYDRFGRFRRLNQGTGQQAGRRYDVITIELPDHSEHKVFFDITELWKQFKPTP